MITTVTLNPALDKTIHLRKLHIGEVNRIERLENIPGGKGINVAKVISKLGGNVNATGFLGGFVGENIESLLKDNFPCAFVKIAGETRSNSNILSENGVVTEILEPGPIVSETEVNCFLQDYSRVIAESEVVVLSGSVPRGVSDMIYQRLITLAKEQGKKVILDTSGNLLAEGSKACPDLIKPNKAELEYLAEKKLESLEEIEKAAEQIREQGVLAVLVSLGAEGILYVGEKGHYALKPPKIAVKNTVGCGDSLVAAMAMGMEKNEDIEKMLTHAIAVSTANAMTTESGSVEIDNVLSIEKELSNSLRKL